MKAGDLVRHRVVHGLRLGLVVFRGPGVATVYVLWSKHQDIGPTIEEMVSLELVSEAR